MPHQATLLRRAADLLQNSGLRANGWGAEGGPICMGTALALAMGADPRRLGRFGFHAARSNEVVDAVGGLILSSGLMEMLPVPDGRPGARRRQRPEVISARRAVIELACWSDAPGRTAAFAAEVLRDRAAALEASGFDLFRDTELLAAPTAGMRATSRELTASTR